jgi:Cu/Ag efflux protein CusF
MWNRIFLSLMLGLTLTSAAQAQNTGGRGDRGDRSGGRSSPPSKSGPTPVDKIEINGVVKSIDTAGDRITIAYDAVDALDWPPGTMPFAVSKPDLLNGIIVGEKVSFRLESQQIYDLRAYKPPPPPEF